MITVKRSQATRATINVSYLLPGATWEPMHELRASLDGRPVSLASYAVVTQSTGEDWTEVNLSLSTQRSTATMKIPELEAFLVGSGHKLPRFVAGGERDTFAEARRNYSIQNSSFNRMKMERSKAEEFGVNQSLQMENARRAEVVFERLQRRGTTAHFPAASKQIVRSDARPVRVPIGSTEMSAQHRIIAAPEASLNAARTVDLTNNSKQALLPGRVALYMDGVFLGPTETDFVAPNESFSLFLGVADQIKLTRVLDKKKSDLTRGGSKTKMKASFLVTVENLSDRESAVQLTDRIPVSETDEVRVSSVKIAPDIKQDVKGLVKWDLAMQPKQVREFRVEYTMEYPNDYGRHTTDQLLTGSLRNSSGIGGGGGGGGINPSKSVTPIPGRGATPSLTGTASAVDPLTGQEIPATPASPLPPQTLSEQIESLERKF